jgi:WD40 repeat-containing protein SMU1
VVLELLEAGERDLARGILRSSDPLLALKTSHLDRYNKLEHFVKRPYFNASDAYEMGSSKELRRQEIADSLACEVSVVEPARLLSLLGQALKYQQSQNLLPVGVPFDVFRNARKAAKRDVEEKNPKKSGGIIRSTRAAKVDSLVFSPDGQCLVSGSAEGVVEGWDVEACELRQDLEHQARGECIDLGGAVLCSTFSRDGEMLATGSSSGQIKVWKISTGACVRAFTQAHPEGITSVCFYRDGTQVLSASYDQTARIHGMKSGRALKEFRGHTSFVNCALYTKDSSNTIVTGSADGTVRLWDLRSTECLLTFRPGQAAGSVVTRELAVHTIQLMPNSTDQVFICTSSSQAFIMTIQGQLVKKFWSGKQSGGDFTCATVSPQGKWVYCVGEDGVMYIFDTRTGQLENVLTVSEGPQVLSVVHHPHRNIMATTTNNECLKIWKP